MSKKKLFLIIGGSVLGVALLIIAIFICYEKHETTKFLNAGTVISSSNTTELVWCKSEEEFNYYLAKKILIENGSSQDTYINTLLVLDTLKEKAQYEMISDFFSVKDVRNNVQEGYYVFLDKKSYSCMILYIEYDERLRKENGRNINAVSLQDCWIIPELSFK